MILFYLIKLVDVWINHLEQVRFEELEDSYKIIKNTVLN